MAEGSKTRRSQSLPLIRRLDQDSNRLNQREDSDIWGFVIQDAGWGWGPASDGKTLFARPAGSCDWFGCKRPYVPGDGGAVWGERGQRCQVVAALADERQRGGQAVGGGKQLLLQANGSGCWRGSARGRI